VSDKDPKDPNGADDDEFLKGILPESGSPNVSVLSGVFLGSGTGDTYRLYTALDLSQYFEIPKDKVLGIKRRPAGQVLVWVPKDLRVHMVASQSMTAEFLRGSIQAAYLARAQRQSGMGSLLPSARINDTPPSVFGGPFCQTDVADPSNPICGTTVGCPPPPQC
jgi:hypothetical protein